MTARALRDLVCVIPESIHVAGLERGGDCEAFGNVTIAADFTVDRLREGLRLRGKPLECGLPFAPVPKVESAGPKQGERGEGDKHEEGEKLENRERGLGAGRRLLAILERLWACGGQLNNVTHRASSFRLLVEGRRCCEA